MIIITNSTKVHAKDSGTTYYVSAKGNDKNEGSIDKPFRTIKQGVKKLEPGDTLVIREGVYHEAIEIYKKSGSSNAWYTIKGYPGENVVMTGDYKLDIDGMKDPDAITIRESSFWKVEGINVNKYTGAGIFISRSNNVELDNLNISDLDYPIYRPYGTSGIDGESSNFCTVKNCKIYNVGLKVDKPKDHGIYIGYGSYNWTFEDNDIHDNAGAAIQLYGNPNGGSNCVILNNHLYNNHAYGIAIGCNATNNYIYNNVFYGNNVCDVYMLENATNNWFKSNLFLTGYSDYNIQFADKSSVNNSFDYNTYYNNNGNVVIRYDQTLNYDEWKAYNQEHSGNYLNEPDEVQQSIENWTPQKIKYYSTTRLSGSDRFETARSIAEDFNSGIIDNVVITSGYNFTNALSGSVLAKKLNSPILLSGKDDSENQSALEYVKNHLNKSGKIYILGNEDNINENIIIALKNLGYNNIKILQDGEKFGSVKAINDELNPAQGTPIFIVSGNLFADGLSVSAVAASKGYPIILSDVDNLPLEAEQTIMKIKPSQIYIIGGTGAISDNVKETLKELSGLSDNNIIRIWGDDRYSTSLNIAKYFKMDDTTVTLVSSLDYQDALVGSVVSAKLNAPIILLGDNNYEQKKYIDSTKYTNEVIFGNYSWVSEGDQKNLAK
jgi:putative cell wall-binding protein